MIASMTASTPEPTSDFSSPLNRPRTTVVLAMSADGKISDTERSHPRFGSQQDFDHLEQQVALADAVLFGAATLKAGGTAMRVLNPELIEQRLAAGKPEQPIQIVCTRTGNIDPTLKFFQQPIPRYLLTTATGAKPWNNDPGFDHVLSTTEEKIDWHQAFEMLHRHKIETIAVLGGGEIVAALLEADLIDELHLTLCPLLLGSKDAPNPVEGAGFSQDTAPRLELLSVRRVEHELFLHYRVKRSPAPL
jgi:5-amino-6-(5-phosphoribosylamino)uracil reductase